MNPIIRLATKEDALLIADLSHQTFYETFSDDNTAEDMHIFLNEQFTKGKLMLEVGRPENIFMLAYMDNRPAGYVKLRHKEMPGSEGRNDAMEIARLYAVSTMIGRGIGKALMQASIDMAAQLQKEWLWLGVWEENLRAIEFYERWGFEKFGETEFLLGKDLQYDWLMRKRLGESMKD